MYVWTSTPFFDSKFSKALKKNNNNNNNNNALHTNAYLHISTHLFLSLSLSQEEQEEEEDFFTPPFRPIVVRSLDALGVRRRESMEAARRLRRGW